MKKRLISSIIFLIIMVVCASFTAYAYFTAIYDHEDISKMQISSAVLPFVSVVSVESIALEITGKDMIEENASSTTPAVTKYMDEAIKITATTSDTGGVSIIEYNIYYDPIVTYIKSAENNSNKKELVISLYSKLSSNKVVEYNLTGVNKKTLIYNDSFSVSGINNEITEYIDVKLGFYNQKFDQSDNAGISIGGELVFELVSVSYSTD